MGPTRQMILPIEAEPLSQSQQDEERWLDAQRRLEVRAWLESLGDPERVLTRAVSVRQPWVRLIMLWLKTWEFRSRPHGRPGWTIVLHASKRFEPDWRAILREAGAPANAIGDVGAFCAIATLGDCVTLGARPDQMTDEAWEDLLERQLRVPEQEPGRPPDGSDRVWFAWELRDVVPIDPPLPWKGQLGVWELPRRAREQIIGRLQVTGNRNDGRHTT